MMVLLLKKSLLGNPLYVVLKLSEGLLFDITRVVSYVFQIIVTNRFIRNIIPIELRNAGIIRFIPIKM